QHHLPVAEIFDDGIEEQGKQVAVSGITAVSQFFQDHRADGQEPAVDKTQQNEENKKLRRHDAKPKRQRDHEVAEELHGSAQAFDIKLEGKAQPADETVFPVEEYFGVLP